MKGEGHAGMRERKRRGRDTWDEGGGKRRNEGAGMAGPMGHNANAQGGRMNNR